MWKSYTLHDSSYHCGKGKTMQTVKKLVIARGGVGGDEYAEHGLLVRL